MLTGPVVVAASLAYLLLLFAIAWIGDRRAEQGRQSSANPTVYALSLAVYCTSWTFYGSVGRAASGGVAFLPIYLGPTLMAALSGAMLAKIVRIAKQYRITSIADFIAARYGKSTFLGGMVTVIAVVGIMPYISLQLKAVSTTVTVLAPDLKAGGALLPMLGDTALLVSLVLAAFAILFGTRHIDASEHHEGVVLAVAFESVAKLVAFAAVGLFVTWRLYDGFGDIFARAAADPQLQRLFTLDPTVKVVDWMALLVLSMLVYLCLPRQFQVAVVENVDERHVAKAAWLFPLYMFAINLFVLPIAFAGRLAFGDAVDPDTYVLALPLASGERLLAVLAFLGGLSAAASMVIVETIALATMVCNDLVMPVLLRLPWLDLARRSDLSGLLLSIRRWTIVTVVLLGYLYVRLIGETYALSTIGLVSFCAAAQFAPALFGGILWKGATRQGALSGLSLGFLTWLYTLLLPSLSRSGLLPPAFHDGLFGIELLRPDALFGLTGISPITHSLAWSMLANLGAYVLVSLLTRPDAIEHIQSVLFVDVFEPAGGTSSGSRFRRGTAAVPDLMALVVRFVGREAGERAFAQYAADHGLQLDRLAEAGPELVDFAERLLAGAIGTASARVMVSTVVTGEVVGLQEVMEILDEASEVIAYSQQLETKSRALEAATAELEAANRRLKELDRLKDDFVATVTHELRTPLTSIRSFSEILHDNPGLDPGQRREFLAIVIKESERLTRLINQVLDVARMESGRMAWTWGPADPRAVVEDAVRATGRLFSDRRVALSVDLPDPLPRLWTDRDKLMQVVINLLSNAVKFVEPETGRVSVTLRVAADSSGIEVDVGDNGPGVPPAAAASIFDKFHQMGDTLTAKPQGTGLGLAISKGIVEHLGGRIWVEPAEGGGALFRFFVPYRAAEE